MMLLLITWTALDYGVVWKGKAADEYVVEGGAYEIVKYGVQTAKFTVKAEHPFTVEVKFWYDGEFRLKRMHYPPGNHSIVISLTDPANSEVIPTRGLGPRPAVITLKTSGRITVSSITTE